MSDDLVTIVVPAYNCAEFLEGSIQDLLDQTHRNLDIILVNDGSDDATLSTLIRYARLDSRVRCLTQTHGGTGSALNSGFSIADGTYGTWVAADDRKSPEFIEKLLGLLREYPGSDFAFSAFFETTPGGRKSEIRLIPTIPKGKSGPVKDFVKRMQSACCVGVCYLFTMDLKRKCGNYVEYPGEDYIMGMLMGHLAQGVVYLNSPLGTHLRHAKSLTSMLPLMNIPGVGPKDAVRIVSAVLAHMNGRSASGGPG